MTAASPGVIANFLPNEYYPTEEAYLSAIAEVMKEECQAIVQAGFLLQLDCPDLAMTRVTQFAHLTVDAFKDVVALHVDVLNHALDGLAPERMRLHLCWGNYEGPHHYDIPLREILPLVLKARPMGISFEGANPRHAHEWKVWQDIRVPDEKVIIPGVLDSTTNFVEHPELVAERIVRTKIMAVGGGDYIQLDAPNYAQWHVDLENRAAFEAWGHDMAAELVADAEIDHTVGQRSSSELAMPAPLTRRSIGPHGIDTGRFSPLL